jgi:outer membrane protein TolC
MMNVLRNPKVWALALAVGATPVMTSAQQPAAPALPAQVDQYVVGQAVPEVAPGTNMLNLTLEQAMEMALENNLDLRVARMNPQGVDYQLASARAAFVPQLTGSSLYQSQSSKNTSTLEQRDTVTNATQRYVSGMSQTLPWYGGRFTANWTNSRVATNSSQTTRNPAYNSNVSFNYTQPLLAGFKIDNNRNQLRTLSIQRQIADVQLLTTIENTKASVRTAYWNLRQAIEQIEIQRRSLDLANRLFQDNRTKVEIGTLAPIETTTSETQVANAEQALLNAQIQARTAELTLKRLLANGPDAAVYTATINPVETAALSVQRVDIAGAIQRAMADRTDLVQARRNLEVSNLNLEVTRNLTKPQLDLQTGYQLQGAGGNEFRNGVLTNPGDYGQALAAIRALDFPTWNVQFNFTYPLFMKAARANFARAQLQIDQSMAQIKAQELTVTADVTNAGLAVENTYKQFQAAQKAREVAFRNADAEQTRFDVGMSTNYNVVQAQQNLTSQRLAELRAIISYLNAVAEFDRIQRVGR